MSRLCGEAAAGAQAAASRPICDRPSIMRPASQMRQEAGLRRRQRRVVGQIGLHEMMRAAVQLDLVQRLPVQALEQRRVLALHVGQEAAAAARMGGADGETDQRGADARRCGGTRRCTASREPHHTPGSACVDAHGADDLVGATPSDDERRPAGSRCRRSSSRSSPSKDALLLAEHLRGAARRPRGAPRTAVANFTRNSLARNGRRTGSKIMRSTLALRRSTSAEQAPHLPQPALMSRDAQAGCAAASRASGPRIDVHEGGRRRRMVFERRAGDRHERHDERVDAECDQASRRCRGSPRVSPRPARM